ncbi:hypothetical protein ACTGYP_00350 [Streptococcus suis]
MAYDFNSLSKVGEEQSADLRYYRDYTNITDTIPEVEAGIKDNVSMTLARWIRQKVFGKDVRESLALFVEWVSVLTNRTTDIVKKNSDRQSVVEERQSGLETAVENFKDDFNRRYDEQISGNTELDEVIDARGGNTVLRERLEKMDKNIEKTKDYVLLSQFGITQANVESCLIHANKYKLGIVWDRVVSLTAPIVVGKDIPWIRGVHPTTSGINPTGAFQEPAVTIKSYYTAPTKISNLSFNAYHMTGDIQDALVVDYGGWGGSVVVEDVNFYYFKGKAVKLIDAYRCNFSRVLFQGKLRSEKVRSGTDWSSWIDNFDGIGVEVRGVSSFSNANSFDNCVFLKLKIAMSINKCKMNVFKNCTFDQINLVANIYNEGNLAIDNAWGEYLEHGFVNAQIDENLNPLPDNIGFTHPKNISISNFNGLYVVPGGEILKNGQRVPIPGYPLDATVNPETHKYFTWISGLNPIPIANQSIEINITDYTGEMIIEPINQKLNLVKGVFKVNRFSGGKYLNNVEFRSAGKIYAPVFKESNNAIAGYVRLEPYTAQNKSQVILDFTPENGETYNFSIVATKSEL